MECGNFSATVVARKAKKEQTTIYYITADYVQN